MKFTRLHLIIYIAALLLSQVALPAKAQDSVQVVRVNEQQTFPATVPAGNYSGIAYLGGTQYAVVSDKSQNEGFFLFDIQLDSVTGQIASVVNQGFYGSGKTNRDGEGIAFVKPLNALFISGESDNRILGYDLDGKETGSEAEVPEVFKKARGNYGFESLSYNDSTRLLWTCNEATLTTDGDAANSTNQVQNRLRLQSFDTDLKPRSQYAYLMDRPKAFRESGEYAMGVSEVAALDNGSLLVLEREFFVPKAKLGAWAVCKLYQVFPDKSQPLNTTEPLTADSPYMSKHLLAEWTTRLGLFTHRIANYEGMCLGPELADGSRVLVLISDSQNQYAGVLKDWFKTIVIK